MRRNSRRRSFSLLSGLEVLFPGSNGHLRFAPVFSSAFAAASTMSRLSG